jgi:hypothetical protein
MMLTEIFHSKAFQKVALNSSGTLGVLGILSGAWQAANGDIAGLGGVVSGVVLIAISGYGLRVLKTRPPLHCA